MGAAAANTPAPRPALPREEEPEEDAARSGHEWANWSGSLRFTPARVVAPERESEVASLVRRAHDEGRLVRPVGCGHSSSPLVETRDTLVSLERLRGVVSHDAERNEATVRAGTRLDEMGPALLRVGLARGHEHADG